MDPVATGVGCVPTRILETDNDSSVSDVIMPILVPGTDSYDGDDDLDWYCPKHQFGLYLTDQGAPPLYDEDKPFIWSTSLAGVPILTNKRQWHAGGAALSYFVIAKACVVGDKTAIIAHSHALQVVLYACAEHKLKVHTLISVGSPVRADMMEVARKARQNIYYWLHIYSDFSDRWQIFGEMFDGHFGIVRAHPLADRNDFVPDVGHSGLLRNKKYYPYWAKKGWIDVIKDPDSTSQITSLKLDLPELTTKQENNGTSN